MSPEQGTGSERVDGRSDLYSLAVLYEMLAGEPPYTGPTAQAIIAKRLSEPVPHVRTLQDTVPEVVERALERALAKVASDRFASVAAFAAALVAPAPPRRHFHRAAVAVAALLAIGVGGAVVITRAKPDSALDPNLVAVAPFDVLDPKLELWHEGLMDLLSRNLDGAGPLRTVSPTVVVRRWRGRADRASAEDLGRRTGARLTVFGNVVGAGQDTVRVSASILDAASGRLVAQVERHDLTARLDRLTDSLTIALLRELGQTRPIAAVRLSSFGSTNPPALREFLQGEHFFRHLALDSALAHYRHAIALDSTFAPALRRIYLALWWQARSSDSIWITYAFRAAAHNHKLAPRESVLVVIDSLAAAMYGAYWQKATGTDVWNAGRRLHRILDQATGRFPADPEIWYELGEARWHFGFGTGAPVTLRAIVDAMDHAIALDSEFAPALMGHSIESSLRAQDVAAARRYVRMYLTFGRGADFFPVAAYVEDQLDADRAASPHGDSMLAAMSGEQLANAWFDLSAWPDTAEVAVALAGC